MDKSNRESDYVIEAAKKRSADPFGFEMTEDQKFAVSAEKIAYDVLGDSFFTMSKAQRRYILDLVRSGDLTSSEIAEEAKYATPYDPSLGLSEQQLTSAHPDKDYRMSERMSEETKSLRAKEMSEAEFYKTFFNYDYKETEIPQKVREIYAGLMGTSVENAPKTSDNLPRQRIESPIPDSEKRIAMATGGTTNQNTPFYNPDTISQQDYLSGPVDFYSQSLGQSTGIQTTDPDDDKDEDKEEITTPNIFAPIGAGQDGKEDLVMSSLAMGLEDPGSFKSFGVADVADSIKATPYTDAGLFSEQTGDLVKSFGREFSSNLDHIKKEVTSIENLFDISFRDFGTGVQKEKPFGKGLSQMTAPPAVMMAMGPMGSTFAGLAAIGGAANHAIQKQNAAIFKATGAGFIGEFNGQMVSRKPGSLIYSGNVDSKEMMAAREAIQKGFIPGTLKAETWDGKKWGQATGKKPMLLQDGKDMSAAGGTYDPETGSFITLDGKGAAMGTMKAAQAMANKVDALLGTTGLMAAEDVNTIRSQVNSNIFGTVTGKNFEQRYRDEVVSRAQTATGLSSSQINDILDGRDFSVTGSGTRGLTSKGFSTFSDFRGTSEEATGDPLDDYFSPESKAKRAADMKAEQDRRDAATAKAAREAMSRVESGFETQDIRDDVGDQDYSTATGVDRGNYGETEDYKLGGRVGMQAGGEAGFAQRPEFVGGNETPTDGQSIADDNPREVPEGTFVINAAAVDFAGREDIEKMIRKAYAKAGDMGQTGVSQEVDIAVSEGEVIIPPHIAKIIGYDRLNKINNRGKKEISRRQEEREEKAAKGGFISKKK